MGASLQLLPNRLGGILLVILLVYLAVWWISKREYPGILNWLQEHVKTILTMEVLFALAFVFWAWVRANNPEITGTEKPMELAFINAILRSEGFPPRDPWLSGYAISYYYFGYVLLGMMIRLTGVTAGMGFNLGNSLWFALVALGTYSLVYNLINKDTGRQRFFSPLLGPLATLMSGNLGGILEVIHSRHIFWRVGPEGGYQSAFWTWLGLEDLEMTPFGDPSLIPQRYLWWWRSSRVIRDLDLNGIPIGIQSIDEFPFFSFLLADNHPHVLALPVVLIALGFAMQLLFTSAGHPRMISARRITGENLKRFLPPIIVLLVVLNVILGLLAAGPDLSFTQFMIGFASRLILDALILLGVYVFYQLWGGQIYLPLSKFELIFGGWIFGALAFLNTWDFPIYLSLVGLILFWKLRAQGIRENMKSLGTALFALLFLGILFYLPWYPTFSSQAGGILPHLLQPTRLIHFFIMFAPSFIPIAIWLVSEILKGWNTGEWRWLLGLTIAIPLSLLLLSWGLAVVILLSGGGGFSLDSILGTMGVNSLDELIQATLRIRLTGSWTALTLGGILASAFVLLRRRWNMQEEASSREWILFLIIIGGLLILGPEFLYLRDQFGLRMNTIFKFYFAAWIVWSLAAAKILHAIGQERNLGWLPLQVLAILPLLMGLVYPVLSVWTKTEQFQPHFGRTLEGAMHPSYMNPDDRSAIQWMNANLEDGVIAEAVGGSYTYYTRISTHTGFPTVLGWPGHEGQWRGGYLEQGSRQDDIRQLYQSTDWFLSKEILDRYDIDYVIIGDLERRTYPPVFEAKFDAYMDLIYANDTVKIFARSGGNTS